MANFCALCGTSISFFSKGELTCCGESQQFCPTCYETLYDLNHFERTRILLERGRPVNPEKMRPILEQYDQEQADKQAAREAKKNASLVDTLCLRCGIPMRSLGTHFVKLGRYNYGISYSKDNLYRAGSIQVHMLHCETCGKTEFFSNGIIADNIDYSSGEDLVECPVCGTLRDPNGGCPHCAMNNAADRISTAPKAPKKGRQGEKPPWEK